MGLFSHYKYFIYIFLKKLNFHNMNADRKAKFDYRYTFVHNSYQL
eukprot:UN20786